jgi:hypothetical protein
MKLIIILLSELQSYCYTGQPSAPIGFSIGCKNPEQSVFRWGNGYRSLLTRFLALEGKEGVVTSETVRSVIFALIGIQAQGTRCRFSKQFVVLGLRNMRFRFTGTLLFLRVRAVGRMLFTLDDISWAKRRAGAYAADGAAGQGRIERSTFF